ncbi:photosystem II 5 kDa protein, chloroplastic-like [Nicotiana tabacum]|uniref:Photosystem II 5 kDa protein, chloroplastic-like n=3 Tax=Nicotiana TaxID=4085 RepID=A0A1S3YXD0_TOBAC|nr:PREDICTED: photosystem II 5 kDa protein, chloroplastic-like [Nicotiana sylvestris]XP_016456986.1 PREDICTED: photosystem II 5 kDa protein, chloroplastic-like [Nicotiana tabacum]
MASLPSSSSFLGNLATTISNPPPATTRGKIVMVKASKIEKTEINRKEEISSGRRELAFALLASAAASSFARIAMAEEEPKRGTPEAKKKYAPICVTMPTARICHK